MLTKSRPSFEGMSIGLGIFLFVVGAIVTFALNVTVDWVNLDLVGYLLMGAGVIITIIGIALLVRRRSAVTTERTVTPAGETVAERSTQVSGTEQP
jgi:nitrate reductase gamma subunit